MERRSRRGGRGADAARADCRRDPRYDVWKGLRTFIYRQDLGFGAVRGPHRRPPSMPADLCRPQPRRRRRRQRPVNKLTASPTGARTAASRPRFVPKSGHVLSYMMVSGGTNYRTTTVSGRRPVILLATLTYRRTAAGNLYADRAHDDTERTPSPQATRSFCR